MGRLCCALLFVIFSLPATAETLTLASTYDVAGTNPNGSKYKGTAEVHVISNSTFTIKWTVGNEVIEGFGMRMNDALAATYRIQGDPVSSSTNWTAMA